MSLDFEMRDEHDDCVRCARQRRDLERKAFERLNVACKDAPPGFRQWVVANRYHESWGQSALISAQYAWEAKRSE